MASGIIGRRSFLITAGRAGIGISVICLGGRLIGAAEAANENVEAFRSLSGLVTGKSGLDISLAERAYTQLTALDSDFPKKVAALADLVRSSGAKTVDALLAAPNGNDQASRSTIVTIVSAWYLGYTGTPISLRAEDDTKFVTFTKALMWEPTIDATVRPSYARGGTNYWIDPPPFVNAPPAEPGIKVWGRESPQGIGTIPGLDKLTLPADPSPASTQPDP